MFSQTQFHPFVFKRAFVLCLWLLALMVAITLILPAQLAAADCEPVVVVTSNADSGGGSLRQAIADVCDGGDITFDLPLPATITLTSAELTIAKPLSIHGPGANLLTVNGNHARRIFNVSGVGVFIDGLTVRAGTAHGDGGGIYNAGKLTLSHTALLGNANATPDYDARGGGIFSSGTLTVTTSTFSGNTVNGSGGGIYNDAGIVYVSASTFSGNATSGGSGGGIYSTGNLTLNQSALLNNTNSKVFYEDEVRGGGIFNSGALTIATSTFSGNVSSQGRGGGIYSTGSIYVNASTFSNNAADYYAGLSNSGGSLTIISSNFSNNSANGCTIYSGGPESAISHTTVVDNVGCGISNGGVLTINNSTIAGNVLSDSYGHGGGILNWDTLTINNSVISGNSMDGIRGGGGIGNEGTLTINNSTISGNAATYMYATDSGGGINNWDTLIINNSTISDNIGGGISSSPYMIPASLSNSIIAYSSNGGDCSSGMTSLGHNLDSDGTCNLTGPGDLPNTDPLLGPLQDNGGETETHALLTGSPAIDAGDNDNCPPTDQRGVPRPQGLACDIGAYEAEPAGVAFYLSKAADDVFPLAGQLISYTILVQNDGYLNTATAAVSDTLPAGLTFAGPVTLTPPQPDAILAQSAADLPALASNLTITAFEQIMLTLPVTVNADVLPSTTITNTAAATSTEVIAPVMGSAVIKVCGTIVVTNTADSGPGSLRQAIADVCDGHVIAFSLPLPALITLTSGELVIARPMTIHGPGATMLAISGNNASRVFNVSGNGVYLENLTIKNGSTDGDGAGIYNNGGLFINSSVVTGSTAQSDGGGVLNNGTLTVNNSTISSNTSVALLAGGGGIDNSGALTLNNSVVSGNTADCAGGGIENDGTLTVNRSIFTNNETTGSCIDMPYGGAGIQNYGDLTISDSRFANNNASVCGGAINNWGGDSSVSHSILVGNQSINGGGICNLFGTVTIEYSTLQGNSSTHDGGGLTNKTWQWEPLSAAAHGNQIATDGTYIISHSTFANNHADGRGGGIHNDYGTLSLVNSTLSGNTADAAGGGIENNAALSVSYSTLSGNSAGDGGGLRNYGGSAATALDNSIIANNLSSDCSGPITSLGHNLDSDGSCSLTDPSDLPNVDPLLGPLQDNGGESQTHALLAGSPAIDAGDTLNCPDTDQRDVPRPQGTACDIGSYEVEAPTAFGLVKQVDDVTVIPGQVITYTIRVYNAHWFSTTTAAISDTLPSELTFVGPVQLEPPQPEAILAQSGADLPALASNLTITTGQAITLTLPVVVNMDVSPGTVIANTAAVTSAEQIMPSTGSAYATAYGMTIIVTSTADSGPGSLRHAVQYAADGATIGFDLATPATITLTSGALVVDSPLTIQGPGADRLTISGNHAASVFNVTGSGVLLDGMTIRDGSDLNGGGIANSGILTISHSALTGNTASVDGGALHNHGTLTILHSTISGNRAGNYEDGGAIYNCGTLTIGDSTLSGNQAGTSPYYDGSGGGIYNWCGLLTIYNSTLSDNSADIGGGVMAYDNVTISHSTLAGNAATTRGGGIAFFGSTLTLNNSIIADSPSGSDCYGAITSLGHNLDSDGSCSLTGPGDLPNTDPLLGPLQDNGGATFTHALLVGSPAMDSGDNDTCPDTDQRGVARPKGTGCDMGAYEAVGILVRMNYQYWMNDSSSDNGRYTLLADATYVDESSRTGVWQYQATPAPRLLLRYDAGFGCQALSVGYFTAPGQVRGWRICLDGSGVVGYWAGGIVPASAQPR